MKNDKNTHKEFNGKRLDGLFFPNVDRGEPRTKKTKKGKKLKPKFKESRRV